MAGIILAFRSRDSGPNPRCDWVPKDGSNAEETEAVSSPHPVLPQLLSGQENPVVSQDRPVSPSAEADMPRALCTEAYWGMTMETISLGNTKSFMGTYPCGWGGNEVAQR